MFCQLLVLQNALEIAQAQGQLPHVTAHQGGTPAVACTSVAQLLNTTQILALN